jgi:hypothetical protein
VGQRRPPQLLKIKCVGNMEDGVFEQNPAVFARRRGGGGMISRCVPDNC